jgi:eukaryotic-like serine/threonine-protein kinase
MHPDGEMFGRFLLQECIGRGGMAEVFRAVAQGVEGFQRVFVVKRIHKDKSANPALRDMFVNEARISALLNHPNIVQVYDFGLIDGCYFISMEHLKGKDLLLSLRQLRGEGKQMPPPLAAYIAREVAAGLAYAHGLKARGGKVLDIVHRDISPSNVMLLRSGGVKLLDFGIAKASSVLVENSGHATLTGIVKGKLSYLSPEQVRNEPLDARSDLFSLGVVFWECLTGKRLFYDKAEYHTMDNVLNRRVPPPSQQRRDVPPELDAIALRALQRDRDRRYQNATAMVEELDAYLTEVRLAPRALPMLLDELFGLENNETEALPAVSSETLPREPPPTLLPDPTTLDVPAPPMVPASSGNLPGAPAGPRGEALLPPAPIGAVDVAPAQARANRNWTLLVAGALVIAAFTGGLLLRPARDPPERAAAAAATVAVHIQSEPAGAEVRGPDGEVLGLTPLAVRLPRAQDPLTIVVDKLGFASARHTITPHRDVTALVVLRPAGAATTDAQRM